MGASKHDALGTDSGAVFVFRKQGGAWVETDELLACDGKAGDRFGWQVRISGSTLLTGAIHDDDNGADSGSAYVYDLSTTGCGAARVGSRNAAPNLDVLRASDPVLGEDLVFTIDTQGFAFATVLGVTMPASRRLDNGYWAFIRIDSPIVFRRSFLPGPIATVSIPIPLDPALCGMKTYSQAKLHDSGPGPFALTNSQDLTLGW
ncbi:MAG TPA: hypothetical protein ENJ09_14095 [Planctomycetes bacterium]|nr:hypothetical protein [Planctomycetota bacterium]